MRDHADYDRQEARNHELRDGPRGLTLAENPEGVAGVRPFDPERDLTPQARPRKPGEGHRFDLSAHVSTTGSTFIILSYGGEEVHILSLAEAAALGSELLDLFQSEVI